MKRSTKRKQEPPLPRPPPSPVSLNSAPPIPPVGPAPSTSTSPFPLLSRYRLPIFLTLSVAAAAFAVFEYRRLERESERQPALAAASSVSTSPALPLSSTVSSLSGRCPVLVSSDPSVIDGNPVLRGIGRYGLPALPYVDRSAAYAYPLLVREAYVSQYNTRTRNANWVIEILNAATAPHAAAHTPAVPPSLPPALPTSPPASVPALLPPDGASYPPTALSPLSRSASAPVVSSSSSLSPSSPSLPRSPSREFSTFHTDPALLPSSSPATPVSFASSSFDRGHLVPAADSRQSQRAMDDSFLLTNISPQHPRFNRQYWSAVESWVRSLRSRWAEIIVVSGPLWLPEGETATAQDEQADAAKDSAAAAAEGKVSNNSSSNRTRRIIRYEMIPSSAPSIHVPTHFFKIIVASSPLASASSSDVVLASFVLPNAPVPASLPLSTFLSSLAAIQHSAGFTFFPLLQPDSELPVKREKLKENSIDLASLLADSDGRGADSGSRGMIALEKRSVLELCGGGGCDLSTQWKELAAWDEVNRKKDRAAAAHRSSKAPNNETQ